MSFYWLRTLVFIISLIISTIILGRDPKFDILKPANSPLDVGFFSHNSISVKAGIEGKVAFSWSEFKLNPTRVAADIRNNEFSGYRPRVVNRIKKQVQGIINQLKKKKVYVDDPNKGHLSINSVNLVGSTFEISYIVSTDYLLIKNHPLNDGERLTETSLYQNIFPTPIGRSEIELKAPLNPEDNKSKEIEIVYFMEKRAPIKKRGTYPEYDQLVKNFFDRKYTLEIGIVFGEFSNRDGFDNDDWDLHKLREGLKKMRFTRTIKLNESKGSFNKFRERWELKNGFPYLSKQRSIAAPIIKVDLYEIKYMGYNLGSHILKNRFHHVLAKNELIYYYGHTYASSGNDLVWLTDKSKYPKNTYQIIFMDGCFSQQHFSKKVFSAIKNSNNPNGDKYLDLVGNVWRGYTRSPLGFEGMLKKIINGTTLTYYFSKNSGSLANNRNIHSWYTILDGLTKDAIHRKNTALVRRASEFIGASGIRANKFNPDTIQFIDFLKQN